MTVNWLGTVGKIKFEENIISHVPVPADGMTQPVSGQQILPVSIAKSNIEFESGSVFFEGRIHGATGRCHLVLNSGRETEIWVGLNIAGTSAYGILFRKNAQMDVASSAGYGERPAMDTWVPMEVRVTGSVIQFFVSEVLVCVASNTVEKCQLGLLFFGNEQVDVRNFRVESVKPIAFVVMQFTDEYNALYKDVIERTCEDFGFKVVRGDDPSQNSVIIDAITRSIRESSIVIADITPDNPNVFYEVGFSHALNKPTILLSDRKRSKLPFDVSGFRTLFYDNTIGGKSVVEASLKKHLQALTV
jgi:hypothetical protein